MLYCATDTQFDQNLFTQNYRPILVRDVMEPEGEITGIVTEVDRKKGRNKGSEQNMMNGNRNEELQEVNAKERR